MNHKIILLLLFFGGFYISCSGQQKQEKAEDHYSGATSGGSWKVSRVLDHKGGIVRYDSSYVKNGEAYRVPDDADSLFTIFKKRFNQVAGSSLINPSFIDSLFNSGFKMNQSLFHPDLLNMQSDVRQKLDKLEKEIQELKEQQGLIREKDVPVQKQGQKSLQRS